MRVLQLFLSLILTTTCFGQYLKPIRGMPFVNRTHRLARGLVGFWLFNEGSGNKVFDLSGNGKYATAINGNSWSGGDISLSDQELEVKGGEYGALSLLGKDFTVVWSCSVSDITTDYIGIISQWGGLSVQREWALLYIQTTGELKLYVDNDATRIAAAANTNLTVGQQDVRAVVFRAGNDLTYYKDGIFDGSPAFAFTPILTTSRRAFIGAWGNDTTSESAAIYEFRGTIKYMYLYNRALSASEIAELYREPFCMMKQPNPLLYTGVVGAPPPPSGQVITIQMSMIPLFFIFTLVCLIRGRKRE